ncbi:hypothetical protein SAMN05414139_06365 [Burkholderia sp. D7]|nr:hypothetical protein SAMN05414139_06365 [Burkholderia sp. D7]
MAIKVLDHLPVFVPGGGPDWHRPQASHLSGATIAVPGGTSIIPAGGLGNPAWSDLG